MTKSRLVSRTTKDDWKMCRYAHGTTRMRQYCDSVISAWWKAAHTPHAVRHFRYCASLFELEGKRQCCRERVLRLFPSFPPFSPRDYSVDRSFLSISFDFTSVSQTWSSFRGKLVTSSTNRTADFLLRVLYCLECVPISLTNQTYGYVSFQKLLRYIRYF